MGKKVTHVQQPNETQSPTRATMVGAGGGLPPLKNKLRRPPAPHGSSEFPVQRILHSESEVLAPPFLIKLSQSVNERVERDNRSAGTRIEGGG